MSQLVERVRGFLKKQDLENAIGTLIDAWHETRAPAIANAIDAIDALVPTPDALETRAWVTAAKAAKTHRERGSLLRTVTQRPSTDIIATMQIACGWDDPRLTTRIVELLKAMPFSGNRTRDVWRAVFDAARLGRDPRLLEIERTMPQTWNVGADTKTFLGNRLKEATEGLVDPQLPAELRDALVALAAEVVPRVEVPANTSSLLDAIYANPEDDEARLVYADWLQERGDPHGELIALQLQPEDKRDRKREKELIKKHKKTWLGPLATAFVGDVEFRRGFPAKGTAKFRHQRDAEQLGGLREWATIEELEFSTSGARDDQETWNRYLHPAMTGLRIVHFPDWHWLHPVKQPWQIEELWVDLRDKQSLHELCAFPTLPKLRNLVVRDAEPSYFEGLERCPPQLTIVDGSALREDVMRKAWFAAVSKLPIERFTVLWFGAGQVHHHFTRDEKKVFSRLDVEIRSPDDVPTDYEINEVGNEIERLPAGTFTHFDARFRGADGVSRGIPDLLRIAKQARLVG